MEDRRGGAPAVPFERRYARLDIRLLAEVDAALGQMSGAGTRPTGDGRMTGGESRSMLLTRGQTGAEFNSQRFWHDTADEAGDDAIDSARPLRLVRPIVPLARKLIVRSVNRFRPRFRRGPVLPLDRQARIGAHPRIGTAPCRAQHSCGRLHSG